MTRIDPARGRILFTRPASPGLWQADLQLRGARRIGERPAVGGGRRLIVTPDRVWLIASSDSCGLLRIDVDAPRQDGTCLQSEVPGVSGVSLAPDGRQLYYSAEQDDTSDIGWMRLPRPRLALRRGLPSRSTMRRAHRGARLHETAGALHPAAAAVRCGRAGGGNRRTGRGPVAPAPAGLSRATARCPGHHRRRCRQRCRRRPDAADAVPAALSLPDAGDGQPRRGLGPLAADAPVGAGRSHAACRHQLLLARARARARADRDPADGAFPLRRRRRSTWPPANAGSSTPGACTTCINDAEHARIHLVADTVGGDGFWQLVGRGQAPQMPKPGWQAQTVAPQRRRIRNSPTRR